MAETMAYQWNSWRKHPRVIPEAERPVRVEVIEPALPAVIEVRDIGEGGIELELAEPPAEGVEEGELELVVGLPEPIAATLRLRGRIRHVGDGRIGVRFADVKPSEREALRRYVQHRLSGESWLARLRRRWWGNF